MKRGAWWLSGLLFLVLLVGSGLRPAFAQDAGLEAEARQALTTVFDALMSGDRAKIDPLLAPEFQIVRSDGATYNKHDYLLKSLPHIDSVPVFSNVVATRNGDIVVVSLELQVEEYLDGKKAESRFPHLIVFRVTPTGWQVVASANFAKLKD
jgi:Domain of unknown function (DUF4440)